MKKIKTFIFNTLILLFSSIILQIISTYFNVYISNSIGEEAVGVFALVMSVYTFGITLASAGINIATTRIVSEELAANNETGSKKAATRCVLFSLFFGICASFIFFIFADFIALKCLHNQISKNVIYLICIALKMLFLNLLKNL